MRHASRTGLFTAGLTSAFLLATAGMAFAHAHLKTASPAPGSTVQAAPDAVAIDFTEGVEPRFSSIEVTDSAGHRVDKGQAATAPADNKHFTVGLQALPAGVYTVTWHATAVDTHKTDGTFTFTVAAKP